MIDHNFVYLAEFAKVVRLLKDFGIRQPRRESHHKDQILLDHAHVGQMFPVLCDPELLGLILLALLCLDLGDLLAGERLEVGGVFCVGLAAGRTQAVPFCPQLVPAESAYLKKKQEMLTRKNTSHCGRIYT
jgi:hypothetical protein